MILRPYQLQTTEESSALFRSGKRRPLLVSPTGSGKTVLVSHMIRTAVSRGLTVWFVVHRRELVEQSLRTLAACGVAAGAIAGGYPREPHHAVQVVSIQTAARRLERLERPRFMVFDEAHHAVAGSWARVIEWNPSARCIGLTATPERLDGRGLGDVFDSMVLGPSVASLIADGHLAPYRFFTQRLDTREIHIRAGEYAADELAAMLDKPQVVGDVVKHYLKHTPGRRAIVFGASVEHSQHLANEFNAAGVVARHVDGDTPADERRESTDGFHAGRVTVLCNCYLFGEGYDVPDAEVCIMARPTASLGLYLQQVGRVLRPRPGKTAFIADHAGNILRHGLPDDEREWSLDSGKRKPRDDEDQPLRRCEECFWMMPAWAKKCGNCGAVFTPAERNGPLMVDGELVEMTRESLEAARTRDNLRAEIARANNTAALQAIAERMGYKPGWVKHVRESKIKRGRWRGDEQAADLLGVRYERSEMV